MFKKRQIRIKKKNKKHIKTSQNAIIKANKIKDHLENLPQLQKFNKNGLEISLICYNVTDIDKEMLNEIFKLEKENMESMYNSCSWGWDNNKKYKEMTENTAKYLVAKNEKNDLVGFSHFRFDMDYGHEVLYCYELQLNSQFKRKGLGKFILQVLEFIAFKNNMEKVVLTVFKHNGDALKFFHSLGYELDETNPEENSSDYIPYQILSKKMTELQITNN